MGSERIGTLRTLHHLPRSSRKKTSARVKALGPLRHLTEADRAKVRAGIDPRTLANYREPTAAKNRARARQFAASGSLSKAAKTRGREERMR